MKRFTILLVSIILLASCFGHVNSENEKDLELKLNADFSVLTGYSFEDHSNKKGERYFLNGGNFDNLYEIDGIKFSTEMEITTDDAFKYLTYKDSIISSKYESNGYKYIEYQEDDTYVITATFRVDQYNIIVALTSDFQGFTHLEYFLGILTKDIENTLACWAIKPSLMVNDKLYWLSARIRPKKASYKDKLEYLGTITRNQERVSPKSCELEEINENFMASDFLGNEVYYDRENDIVYILFEELLEAYE